MKTKEELEKEFENVWFSKLKPQHTSTTASQYDATMRLCREVAFNAFIIGAQHTQEQNEIQHLAEEIQRAFHCQTWAFNTEEGSNVNRTAWQNVAKAAKQFLEEKR